MSQWPQWTRPETEQRLILGPGLHKLPLQLVDHGGIRVSEGQSQKLTTLGRSG